MRNVALNGKRSFLICMNRAEYRFTESLGIKFEVQQISVPSHCGSPHIVKKISRGV